ncbi:MAG: SGNH/GDSL hydrolase family protein [Actinomycetota bacterium]|nr:SGNH/GDSL hydrolase family protein [Actinomycetota bacterium]
MHGRWERHSTEAGRLFAAGAGEHGLILVPLHDAGRKRGGRAMLTDFAADWFHPNDRGH